MTFVRLVVFFGHNASMAEQKLVIGQTALVEVWQDRRRSL
jgi:hypothetical protein